MTITDLITLLLLGYLSWRGWSRGFMRSLIGPVAFIAGNLIGFIYYKITHDFVHTLIIGIAAPILIILGLNIILRFWNKWVDREEDLTPASRLAGVFLNIFWGLSIWIISVVLAAYLPAINPVFEKVHQDITHSCTYALFKRPAPPKPLTAATAEQTISIPTLTANLSDPKTIEQIQANPDFQALANDARLQRIMQDPEIQKAIEEKNFTALMTNPKVLEIAQDPELIKKMMSLYGGLNGNPPAEQK